MTVPATHRLRMAAEVMQARVFAPGSQGTNPSETLGDAPDAVLAGMSTDGAEVPAQRIPEDVIFAGAATDNRKTKQGNLFFALDGARVDGFDYSGAATAAGAVAVVVAAERAFGGKGSGTRSGDRSVGGLCRPMGCELVWVLVVPDVRAALGRLAAAVRDRFNGKVVGVTGSNGKTSTKEMIAASLSAAGPVMKTSGNYNTDVGLPLCILDASGQESFWVLEMAMRGPGEIAYLARIARPHVAIVTNIAGRISGAWGVWTRLQRPKAKSFPFFGIRGWPFGHVTSPV